MAPDGGEVDLLDGATARALHGQPAIAGDGGSADRWREQRPPAGGQPVVPCLDDVRRLGDIGRAPLLLLAALRCARLRLLAFQPAAIGTHGRFPTSVTTRPCQLPWRGAWFSRSA